MKTDWALRIAQTGAPVKVGHSMGGALVHLGMRSVAGAIAFP